MTTRPFYTDDLPAGLRTAQVLGLTASAFLAGKTFSASFSAVPALMRAESPSLLAKQWKTLYDSDKLVAPLISVFSSGIFAFLAYRDETWTKPAIMYTTSSSLLLSLLPFTFLLGEPINKKLEEKARTLTSADVREKSVGEDSVHGLVDKWATVNLARAVISAVGAVTAIWAAVERTDIVPATVRIGTGANRMGN